MLSTIGKWSAKHKAAVQLSCPGELLGTDYWQQVHAARRRHLQPSAQKVMHDVVRTDHDSSNEIPRELCAGNLYRNAHLPDKDIVNLGGGATGARFQRSGRAL